jgi:urease accessory protein
MLIVREILGQADEPRFAGRAVERLRVDSTRALKRRFRAVTDVGTDVAIDLERGSYLRDGAVLADAGGSIIVVERAPEDALVIRLAPELSPDERIARAVAVGHAFGNQHVPLEAVGAEIRVRITTSPEVALATIAALGLSGVEAHVERVPLGRDRPLAGAHGGAHRHA